MTYRIYRNVMAGILAAAVIAAGTITVMAAGTGASAQTGATMNEDAIDEEMMIGIPSPIVEYNTLAEAEKAAGFRFQVPATIKDYEEISYTVISGDLIQVIYSGDSGEICIRKMAASDTEDISGDYNLYGNVETATVRGHEVVIRGSEDSATLATWTNKGYAYSIGIYDENGLARTSQGMSYADMKSLVYVVR